MGEYDRVGKWTLANDFLITDDEDSSGSSAYTFRCRPQPIVVTVEELEAARHVAWPEKSRDDDSVPSFLDRSYIKFAGSIDDRIILFSMGKGTMARFDRIVEGTIHCIEPGQIGGKNNATSTMGIFADKNTYPEHGLMEDEPGRLYYWPATDGDEYEDARGEILSLSLYMDEPAFHRLFADLEREQSAIGSARIVILCELFESQISAALSGPMGSDYGLRLKNEDDKRPSAHAAARLQSITFSREKRTFAAQSYSHEGPNSHQPMTVQDPLDGRHNRALLRYQRWTFWALIFLIALTLYQRP